MARKKAAGFKMKKSPTKFSARLKTWDDYFDQDRFDSRAVNRTLSKSQRQYKIAQKKKAFEKQQATTRAKMQEMLLDNTLPPGKPNFSDTSVPNPYAGGGGRKFQIGDFVDDGVRTMSAMAKKSGFNMKKGSKPSKSEFFKGKK